MANFVEIRNMDLLVLGQVQYAFQVSGEATPLDLGSAMALAGMKRTVVIESEVSVLQRGIKARIKKIDDLSGTDVMARITEALANCPTTGASAKKPTDYIDFPKTPAGTGAKDITAILTSYGVAGSDFWKAGTTDKIQFAKLNELYQNVKLAIDKENNALQRVSAQLQSVLGKRDNAAGQAEKYLKKFDATASTLVRNMGK